jgi:hypothetical protein
MRFKIELLHLIFEKRFSEDINTLLKIILSVAYTNGVGSKLTIVSLIYLAMVLYIIYYLENS